MIQWEILEAAKRCYSEHMKKEKEWNYGEPTEFFVDGNFLVIRYQYGALFYYSDYDQPFISWTFRRKPFLDVSVEVPKDKVIELLRKSLLQLTDVKSELLGYKGERTDFAESLYYISNFESFLLQLASGDDEESDQKYIKEYLSELYKMESYLKAEEEAQEVEKIIDWRNRNIEYINYLF